MTLFEHTQNEDTYFCVLPGSVHIPQVPISTKWGNLPKEICVRTCDTQPRRHIVAVLVFNTDNEDISCRVKRRCFVLHIMEDGTSTDTATDNDTNSPAGYKTLTSADPLCGQEGGNPALQNLQVLRNRFRNKEFRSFELLKSDHLWTYCFVVGEALRIRHTELLTCVHQ